MRPKKFKADKLQPMIKFGATATSFSDMSPFNRINPPTAPKTFTRTPPRAPRRDERGDSREPYRRRSKSRSRSRSRDRRLESQRPRRGSWSRENPGRRYSRENNDRPRNYSQSPPSSARRRPPLEHRADSNRSFSTRSPTQERVPKVFPNPVTEKPPAIAMSKVPAGQATQPAEVAKAAVVALPSQNSASEGNVDSVMMEPPKIHEQLKPSPAVSDSRQAPAQVNSGAKFERELNEMLILQQKESIKMVVLKIQESKAEKDWKRRCVDFNKFEPHHAKFPSTKESQTAARTEAEKAYKQACDAVHKQQSLLDKLTSQEASSMCSRLSTNFEQLDKKYAQRAQDLERQNLTMKKEIETLNSDTTPQLEGMSKKFNDIESSIQLLMNNMAEAKKSAVTPANNQDLAKVNERLSGLEKSISQLTERLTKLDDDCKTHARNLAEHTKAQEDLASRLVKAENKASQTEKTIVDRLKKLEAESNLPAPIHKADYSEIIKSEINPIKEELNKLTMLQSHAQARVNSDKSYDHTVFLSLQKDVAQLLRDVAILKVPADAATIPGTSTRPQKNDGRIVGTDTTPVANSQNSKIGEEKLERRLVALEKSIKSRETSVNLDLEASNTRISKIEQQLVLQTPPATSIQQGVSPDFASRLRSLENAAEELRDGIGGLTEVTGDIVDKAVEKSTASLQKLQKEDSDSLRSSIQSLHANQETMRQETTNAIAEVMTTVTTGATTEATQKVLDVLQEHNIFARVDAFGNAINTLKSEMDGHTHSLENLTSRFDNINTAQLHLAISDTVKQNLAKELPNLRDADDRIAGMQTAVSVLQAMEPRLAGLESTSNVIKSLQSSIENIRQEVIKTQTSQKETSEKLQALQTATQKDLETSTDQFMKCDEQINLVHEGISKLREEIENSPVTVQIEKLELTVKKLESSTIHSQVEDLETRVASLEKVDEERTLKDKARDSSIEKLEKANVERLSKESLSATPAPSRPQSSSRHIHPTETVSSVPRPFVNRTQRPGSVSVTTARSAPTPPSAEKDRNRMASENKKRAFFKQNTNGRKNGSPAAKKQRRGTHSFDPDADDPDDPDFTPGEKIHPGIIQDSDDYSDEKSPPDLPDVKPVVHKSGGDDHSENVITNAGRGVIDLVSDSENE